MKTGIRQIDELCLDMMYISRSLRAMAREELRPLGLNIQEATVLALMSAFDGEVTQKQLLERLGAMSGPGGDFPIDKGAMTRTMQSLEAKKYVLRARNPADSRSSVFTLTPQGEGFRSSMRQVLDRWIGLTTDGVDEADIAACYRVLNRIKLNFNRETGI